MAAYGFFNWDWIDPSTPQLLLSDIGLLRGYGIFDFFNAQNGKPIFMDAHLDRFYRSAQRLHMEVPLTRDELSGVVHELLRKNGEPDAGIRMVLTGGYSENAYSPAKPNLMVLQQPYGEPAPDVVARGVGLITTSFKRELPEIKSTNYLNGIRMLPTLTERDAVEPLYHDHGYVREAVRSNVFIVNQQDELITPDRRILAGITRGKVLELAGKIKKPQVRSVRIREVRAAKEVFITGTYKHVLPVVSIDGEPVGNGKPGAFTMQLRAAFEEERLRVINA